MVILKTLVVDHRVTPYDGTIGYSAIKLGIGAELYIIRVMINFFSK